MTETVILNLISALVHVLLPSYTWDRMRAAVGRWDDKFDATGKKLPGTEKKQGVLDELEFLGIRGAQWLVGALIDLAVMKLRIDQGKPLDIEVKKPEES
jgi:hypothetical protein